MDLLAILAFDSADTITPIGVSFGMHGKEGVADFFLLEVIGDRDSPIRFENRILVFNNASECRMFLERIEPLLPPGVKAEHKYDFVCDISTALTLVANSDDDTGAVLLNCANTLLDFIATGPFPLPDEHKILESLADHLTFRQELGEFTAFRSRLRDALLWCAGNFVTNSMLVRSPAEFEALLPNLLANEHR